MNLQFKGKNREVDDDFLGQKHSEKWSFRGKNEGMNGGKNVRELKEREMIFQGLRNV